MARHGKPEIFNTDQGSQFTDAAFTGVLAGNGVAISIRQGGLAGRRVRRAAVTPRQIRGGVSARLHAWYLHAYGSVSQARTPNPLLDFHNARRSHASLDDATPDQAYFIALSLLGGPTQQRLHLSRRKTYPDNRDHLIAAGIHLRV